MSPFPIIMKFLKQSMQIKEIFSYVKTQFLTNCNTVTGTVEGTVRGIAKDVKTTHHYTTCIFTKTQCGNLNLD